MKIGTIDIVDLEIKKGSSLNFDVTYMDITGAVVPISAVTSKVRDGYDGVVALDIGAYTTIVGGVALIRVPASVTVLLPSLALGRWDFEVTVGTNEYPLMEGVVRVKRSTL